MPLILFRLDCSIVAFSRLPGTYELALKLTLLRVTGHTFLQIATLPGKHLVQGKVAVGSDAKNPERPSTCRDRSLEPHESSLFATHCPPRQCNAERVRPIQTGYFLHYTRPSELDRCEFAKFPHHSFITRICDSKHEMAYSQSCTPEWQYSSIPLELRAHQPNTPRLGMVQKNHDGNVTSITHLVGILLLLGRS